MVGMVVGARSGKKAILSGAAYATATSTEGGVAAAAAAAAAWEVDNDVAKSNPPGRQRLWTDVASKELLSGATQAGTG